MVKLKSILIGMCALVMSVNADLIRYTFEGTVSGYEGTLEDGSYTYHDFLNEGITPSGGTDVKIIFDIDTYADGYCDGQVINDIINSNDYGSVDYFYADYIEGYLLVDYPQPVYGRAHGDINYGFSQKYYYQDFSGIGESFMLSGGNYDHSISVSSSGFGIGNLSIGQTFSGSEESIMYNGNGVQRINSILTLTAMTYLSAGTVPSTPASVPEPVTQSLFFAGIFSFCSFIATRKRKKVNLL